MQMIPRFIPKHKIQWCKLDGCSFRAADLDSLLNHTSSNHFKTELKCQFCPNINNFSMASVLRDHYDKHASKLIFICGKCNTFSSCKKLIMDHARSSHINQDVVVLEVSRDESNSNPVTSYSICLIPECVTININKCIFCDYEFKSKGEVCAEEHLMYHHFFRFEYHCEYCQNMVSFNANDLKTHCQYSHKRIAKINMVLRSRFDNSVIPVKREEQLGESNVVGPPIVAEQLLEIKQELIIDDMVDDIVEIEVDEAPAQPKPQIKLVPINQIMDPRFMNGTN